MQKMLVFDIDGTLMHRGKISKRVVKTLLEAKKQGHLITIATGRNSRGILKLAQILGLDDGQTPIIGLNGAEVFYLNPDHSIKHLWQKPLTKELATKLFQVGQVNHINLVAYTNDYHYLYTNRWFSYLTIFMFFRVKRVKITKINKALSNLELDVMKVVCHGSAENILSFQTELEKLDLAIFGWSYVEHKTHNLEVNMTGINKSVGMIKAAEILKINQSDVIYFGDGANDKEALQWAGVGIAMGNANEQIKQQANQVTKTVKEDGVATWIEENLLRK